MLFRLLFIEKPCKTTSVDPVKVRAFRSESSFSYIYRPFLLVPDARNAVLGQIVTIPDVESLPEFVPIGFKELDVDVTVAMDFFIFHLEGCVAYVVDQHSKKV